MEHKGFGKLFYRCDRIWRCGLDLVVLSGGNCTVAQNALDHRIINAQAVQIRRQAPAEPMPSMPADTSTLEHVFHFPLIASIQVERVSDRVREDQAGTAAQEHRLVPSRSYASWVAR